MALDPGILAQTANPPSPLEMLARVQTIRNLQQQQQMGQQQIQGAQLENQQKQLDLADQQNYRQAWLEADGDPDKAQKLALQKGVGPKTMLAVQQQILTAAKERAGLQGQQFDNLAKKNDALNGLLAPVEAEKDPAKQAALWGQQMQAGVQTGILSPQEAQQHPYPGPDGVHQYRSGLNTEKWINARASQMNAERQQAEFELKKPGMEAQTAIEQLNLAARQIDSVKDQTGYQAVIRSLPPGVVSQLPPTFDPATTPALLKRMTVPAQQLPGYDIESAKANAIKALSADPQAAIAQIDQIIPPQAPGNAQVNQAYKTLLKSAISRGDVDFAKSALEHAAEYAGRIAGETNPQVIGAHVAQAVATARATAPIEIRKEVDKQLALAKNSPEGFNTITNPSSRTAAEAAYSRDSHEYADKVGAAQQFTDFISAAQSGNKAAPGLIPIADVRALLNRVNRQELQSVSTGAGSLLDRIQGRINGLAEGQPIPPDILTDMKKISTVMQQSAERTYGYKVAITNKTFGSKVEPINLQPAAGVGGTVNLRAPDGSVQPVPADQVDHYLKLGAKRVQ